MSTSPTAKRGSARAANSAVSTWLERAESTQVPVFSATVADVTSIVESTSSSAQDLAEAIGRDAGLAARLLKLANSPLFCQQGRQAQTIPGAVVLLGFDAVRDLAITLSVVDQVQGQPGRQVLIETLLQAFHGAGQARSIAMAGQFDGKDEVFLAGLLARLGELVFWSSESPEPEVLAKRLAEGLAPTAAEQKDLVGFSLNEITAALVEHWQLGPLVRAVAREEHSDTRVEGIALAGRIARAANPSDWEILTPDALASDPLLKELVEGRASILKQSVEESLVQIQSAAEAVNETARRFGVRRDLLRSVRRKPPAAAPRPDGPDPLRQVQVLARMSSLTERPVTLDELLQLAIEGIIDGAGFTRVFFALLSPDRKALKIKHQRGAFGPLPKTLLLDNNQVLQQGTEAVGLIRVGKRWSLIGDAHWVAEPEAVLHRVRVGETTIGLMYADGGASAADPGDAARSSFALFVEQIGHSLLASAQRRD